MASWLIPYLSTRIKPTQTAFVQGRYIFDNVLMANKALEWAHRSHQQLTLILLDFKKAFNRVSSSFLRDAMTHMVFSLHRINLTMALYEKASAQ